jgi:hypothetical protein
MAKPELRIPITATVTDPARRTWGRRNKNDSRHHCRHRLASTAPCGTRPCSRKRQSAITNLRATATIKTRQTRPLCPVDRRANHRVIALLGWCLSQAAWIMVPRTWPLPARDIPLRSLDHALKRRKKATMQPNFLHTVAGETARVGVRYRYVRVTCVHTPLPASCSQ